MAAQKSPSEAFRNILVGTDLSPGARAALGRALRLPRLPDGKTVILHVGPGNVAPGDRPRFAERARTEIERQIAREPRAAGVTADVTFGDPFVEIVRRARALGADLIVVGRHGHRPVRDLVLGSTAERTIRKADVPVLVAALPAAQPYERAVVGAALEEGAPATLELALRTAPEAKALALVHAYHVPFEELLAPSRSRGAALKDEIEAEAAAALDTLAASAGPGPRVTPVIRKGDPRTVLLREAARRHAELVVVGTHARSGLAHALLGSVAEWVLRAAPCDVLVARPRRFSFRLP